MSVEHVAWKSVRILINDMVLKMLEFTPAPEYVCSGSRTLVELQKKVAIANFITLCDPT